MKESQLPGQRSEATLSYLKEVTRLMRLNSANPFKIRAFEKAVEILEEQDGWESRIERGTLTELSGIGKGIEEVASKFYLHQDTSARDELKAALPEGLLELVRVNGLGPKKARVLIEDLGIRTLGELEYACEEHRLVSIKGFGEKVQKRILDEVRYLKTTAGKLRLVDADRIATELEIQIRKRVGQRVRVERTGALRRRLEVVDRMDFLVENYDGKGMESLREWESEWAADQGHVPIRIHHAEPGAFGSRWAETTATAEHWKALGLPSEEIFEDEKAFYKAQPCGTWISPEMRETGEELVLAEKGELEKVLGENSIRGVFHNHTTRSDGDATMEEMVSAAEALGYEYIGISDHSQTSVYAHGLKEGDLDDQYRELLEVRKRHPNIQVYWGIESDILKDGSLDYPDHVLSRFDFVIASVHARYNMDGDDMTQRILKAIRNPHTRFIGHITGRLLLGRKPSNINMETILQEAASHDVAIEINANPARLDIDWRYGPLLRKYRTPVAVNPDAHSTHGLGFTRYGVTVARKALIPQSQVLNAGSTSDIGRWLRRE